MRRATVTPVSAGRTPEGRMSWLRLRYMAPSPMEMRRRRLAFAARALVGVGLAMLLLAACSFIGKAVFRG